MIYSSENMPNKCFGFFKEYSSDYVNCPSVSDFIDPASNQTYDKAALVRYLSEATIIVVTSRLAFPNPINGAEELGSLCVRTDGEWTWLDDIADFVNLQNLVIPAEMYESIRNKSFVLPYVDQDFAHDMYWGC